MRIVLFILIWGILAGYSIGITAAPKNQKPIRIILNDWTSQIVLAKITGELFKEMGYRVEYLTSNTNEQWGAMSFGVGHVQVEVWEGTMSEMFNRMVKEGRIMDAGSHQAITREEWWYPIYVEKQCPGLPDWKALKACAKLFATPETTPKGRYFGGPWEKPEEAKIRALGLNFKATAVKHANDLWIELDKAVKIKRPIVLFNWTPNWVEARYEGKFVEFPEYSKECEINPAWGVNPNFHYDCGNPKNGWLKKASWSGMEKTWPCAFQVLKNINFDNAMISKAAAWVDVDLLSYDQAVAKWTKTQQALWKSWIPKNCLK